MLFKLYLWLCHWLQDSLPKHDDTHIKCARCGWESEHINGLKFIFVGGNEVEGLCLSCYGGTMYHKKDWRNLKADSIPLTFKVLFKGDEYEL